MREIKFRVYIKQSGTHKEGIFLTSSRMFPVDCIDFEQKIVFITLRSLGKDTQFHFDFDDVELIQYTGLKDRNGKEIFEGDIIQRADLKGIVLYQDSGFVLKWINHEPFTGDLFGAAASEFIIGNMHQNLDLLVSKDAR